MTHKKQFAIGLLLSGIGFGLFQNCAPDINLEDYKTESADSPSNLDTNVPPPVGNENPPSVSLSLSKTSAVSGVDTLVVNYVTAYLEPFASWACRPVNSSVCGISVVDPAARLPLPGGQIDVRIPAFTGQSTQFCSYVIECRGPDDRIVSGSASMNWEPNNPPQVGDPVAATGIVLTPSSDVTYTIKQPTYTAPTFTVTHAQISGQTYTYQWKKGPDIILGATSTTYTPSLSTSSDPLVMHANLRNIRGDYSVTITAAKAGTTATAVASSAIRRVVYTDTTISYVASCSGVTALGVQFSGALRKIVNLEMGTVQLTQPPVGYLVHPIRGGCNTYFRNYFGDTGTITTIPHPIIPNNSAVMISRSASSKCSGHSAATILTANGIKVWGNGGDDLIELNTILTLTSPLSTEVCTGNWVAQ